VEATFTECKLVLDALRIGGDALRHLTTVLESQVSHKYSFALSIEDATTLVETVDLMVDANAVLLRSLRPNDSDAQMNAVRKYVGCWIANLEKLRNIIDSSNSAWRDQYDHSESEFKSLLQSYE
jgi:hypothetical protein